MLVKKVKEDINGKRAKDIIKKTSFTIFGVKIKLATSLTSSLCELNILWEAFITQH